jgi:hypothetical protein
MQWRLCAEVARRGGIPLETGAKDERGFHKHQLINRVAARSTTRRDGDAARQVVGIDFRGLK